MRSYLMAATPKSLAALVRRQCVLNERGPVIRNIADSPPPLLCDMKRDLGNPMVYLETTAPFIQQPTTWESTSAGEKEMEIRLRSSQSSSPEPLWMTWRSWPGISSTPSATLCLGATLATPPRNTI